jgi:hypothetical protein
MRTIALRLAAFSCIVIALNTGAQIKWFSANVAGNTAQVENNAGGSPTTTLLYVPTSVTFSGIYLSVAKVDNTTGNYYDLGIGKCPSLDCSQPNVTVTIVCNLGTSGSSGRGVNLTSVGAHVLPCAQGSVTISAGTYVLLGAGNATVAQCKGLLGDAPVIPFVSTVSGTATNGSLTNPNSTIFTTAAAGVSQPSGGCNISLH